MADGTLNYFDRLFNIDPALLDRMYSGLQRRGVQEDKIPVALSYILEESGGDPRRSDKYGRGLVDGIDFDDNMFIDDDDSLIESQLDSIYDGVSSGRIDLDIDPGMTAYGSMLQYGYGGKLFAEGGPTVSQVWEERTGKPWQQVGEYYSSYDKSLKGNLALLNELNAGKWDYLKSGEQPQVVEDLQAVPAPPPPPDRSED